MSSHRVKLWALGTVLAVATACAPIIRNHGYAPTDSELSSVIVGLDTKGSVEEAVGLPTTEGVLTESAWYYLSSRRQARGPFTPEILDRQLVAISFAGDGVVTNIERFTLEDGRVVPLSRRVTDNAVRNTAFLRQLLGNLGNFDVGRIIDPGE
ncbi:MAG: outer membrane protein assembly factor BamE [Shimia sp.]